MNQNCYVHCYIIGWGWHIDSLHNNVSIHLNKKFQLRGSLKGGGGKVFWNIYISMIMQS